MDSKSYLLDFKSLAQFDEDSTGSGSGRSSGRSTPRSSVSSSAPMEIHAGVLSNVHYDSDAHHVMEFFEMCSDLIVALAC